MRNDITRERKGLKRGRRTLSGAKKGKEKAEPSIIQVKIDSEVFPHVRGLLQENDPAVIERMLGVTFSRDLLLLWPLEGRTQSARAACILEAIGRRVIENGGTHGTHA
jgi:hypothetical protein